MIDSRVVDRSFREILWPELKAIGFRRSGRTAWRDRPDAVQVVSAQSFNRYLADGIGATTFSFGIALGVFYPVIEAESPLSHFRGDPTRPAEWDCHARNMLGKGIDQPDWIGARPPDRRDVWYVRPDGSNVPQVVADARDQILSVGVPWLEGLSDLREARRAFAEDPGTTLSGELGGASYCGAIDSSDRFYAIEALSTLIDDTSRRDRRRG